MNDISFHISSIKINYSQKQIAGRGGNSTKIIRFSHKETWTLPSELISLVWNIGMESSILPQRKKETEVI